MLSVTRRRTVRAGEASGGTISTSLTSSFGRANGKGRSTTAWTTLNIVTADPTPSATVSPATAVNAGVPRRVRKACRTSFRVSCSQTDSDVLDVKVPSVLNLLRRVVPAHRLARPQRRIGELRGARRLVADTDVGVGRLAAADAIEPVLHVRQGAVAARADEDVGLRQMGSRHIHGVVAVKGK